MSTSDAKPSITAVVADCPPARSMPREFPITVRFWGQTLLWTGIGMLACFVAYCIEKYLFRMVTPYRVFANPAEIAMRIFGLPHFIVGLFFMLSARRMHTFTGWLWFFGLLAVGVGFAYGFNQLGAHKNPVMLIAFYFYFLIHGFRDESYFYQSYGDCPTHDRKSNIRVLVGMQVMLIALLFAFIMPTYLKWMDIRDKLPSDDPVLNLFFPASLPFVIKFGIYLIPALALSGGIWWLLNRNYPGGWRAIRRDHQPILFIFAGSAIIIFATLVVGPWTFNYVVLAHFVGWYFFAIRKLAKVPPDKRAPASHPMTWMRTTVPGFRVMHLGLAAIVIILIMISQYSSGSSDSLSVAVSGPSFYYWTVLHVSLSFYPR